MTHKDVSNVDQIDASELEQFQKTYLPSARPVVLKGLARNWPAFRQWDEAYLRRVHGQQPVSVNTPTSELFSDNIAAHGDALQAYQAREITLSEYMDILAANPKTRTYLEALPLTRRAPRMWEEVVVPPYVPRKSLWMSTFWYGPQGTTTPLHYDVPHNTLVQLRGQKKLTLFAPGDVRNLYPVSWTSKQYPMTSRVNLKKPDLVTFPRFERATPYEVVLEPGDGLFLPGCWWHEVQNLTVTLAVNFWWWPPLRMWADPAFCYLGLRGGAATALMELRDRMSPPEQGNTTGKGMGQTEAKA